MGSTISKITNVAQVLTAIGARLVFGWTWDKKASKLATSPSIEVPTFLQNHELLTELKDKVFADKRTSSLLSDEALIKICRQIEFWYAVEKISNEDIIKVAKNLVEQSTWYNLPQNAGFKVPTRRFGKTELQMPILTTGGMRLQSTWFPDSIPLLTPNRKQVLEGATQENMKNCIRLCLKLGMNHFETARMYGTSEYQMVEALHELIVEGEIRREDFIFQTKIVPGKAQNFRKLWNASWNNIGDKLGYIDLFGVHCINKFDEATQETLEILEGLKEEGKIRHIGFSTHGTASQIMNLINTERFDYVNLHYHYFGSYHASGTQDTKGGEGNLACVARALELDMGVFQISPIDKGGKLFQPSAICASLIGPELTPISFALLYAWKKVGFHTTSIGLSKLSDLDEVLAAARLIANNSTTDEQDNSSSCCNDSRVDQLLDSAIDRLEKRAEAVNGKEWMEKGLLNLPSMFDESSDGIGIGQILWLNNLLTSYGMYDFSWDRYSSLVHSEKSWNKKKKFKENEKTISAANPGRAYDTTVDLEKALENHYNPALAIEKMKEVHEWLNTRERMKDDQLKKIGMKKAYNLTVWEEYPGYIVGHDALKNVLLSVLTGGRKGFETGPDVSIKYEADQLKSHLFV